MRKRTRISRLGVHTRLSVALFPIHQRKTRPTYRVPAGKHVSPRPAGGKRDGRVREIFLVEDDFFSPLECSCTPSTLENLVKYIDCSSESLKSFSGVLPALSWGCQND